MKFMKYLLATALAFAFCATASVSHAQTAVYTASGSSALWIELGQAATALPDTGCYWTAGKSANITAFDDRAGVATGEQGNIWIAWGPGPGGTCAAPVAPFNVYSQMNLDSVLGDRSIPSLFLTTVTQTLHAPVSACSAAHLSTPHFQRMFKLCSRFLALLSV
jgi:hypothetical protein